MGSLLLWPMLAPASGPASPPQRPQGLPDVTPAQGRALIELARTAMAFHLARRASPDAVPAIAEIRPLRQWPNAAAVTLRSNGAVAAVQVRAEADLLTNVAAAAIQAMRSPKLPDRVDQKVLDALTVEVEVLSELRPTAREELDGAIVPGLSGLAYWRGDPAASRPAEAPPGEISWVLPSAAYVLGLDAEGMRRAAMARFRLTSANAPLPARLAVFTARHYVGFPDGRILELFRGKDLSLRASPAEPAMLAAARQVGRFLAAHQSAAGRYELPEGGGSIAEHLYAAWAMARLARRTGDAQLAKSAGAAAACAESLIRRSAGRAVVVADAPDEMLAATALLALTLAARDTDPNAQRLRGELAQGLLEALGRPTAAPASRPAATSQAACIAFLALGGAEAAAGLRQAAGAAGFADPVAALWACRARLPGAWPWPKDVGISQLGQGAIDDEKGALLLDGRPAATVDTALAAACLAASLDQAGISAGQASKLRSQLLEARRFCWGMIHQPGEAYFRADGDEWVGAVRASPGCASVTLPACAAALEALLLR